MSLFKERATNAKKLISLENTIIALKKQLAFLSNSSNELEKLQATIEILEKENIDMKKKIETFSCDKECCPPKQQPKKRQGRKKVSKNLNQQD